MDRLSARRMKTEDLGQAVSLVAMLVRSASVSRHARAYGGPGGDDAIARALRLTLEHPERGFVWVVEDGARLVALAIVCFAVSTNLGAFVAKIPDLVVHEDARRRGVGSFLISSLVAELRAIGVGRIDLGVHDGNAAALRFYERLGFTHNHEIGLSLIV